MQEIVVADIFGRTPALEKLSVFFGEGTEIIDPYAGERLDFRDESQSYTYFMDRVGLDGYCAILREKLRPVSRPSELIGFSVGASVTWRISDSLDPGCILRAVCFYGSQIRYYRDVNPSVTVDLVWPRFERHFDVDKLAREMALKSNVRTHRTPYLHGFMNPLARNFDRSGFEKYVAWLQSRPLHPVAQAGPENLG